MNRRTIFTGIAAWWGAQRLSAQLITPPQLKPGDVLIVNDSGNLSQLEAGGACPDSQGIGRPCPPASGTLVGGGDGHIECIQCGAKFYDTAGMLRHLDMVGVNHKKTYRPNECPVCGTAAEPYVRLTEVNVYGNKDPFFAGPGCMPTTNLSVCVVPSAERRTGPMEHVTRCRRCSAAFWQTAAE